MPAPRKTIPTYIALAHEEYQRLRVQALRRKISVAKLLAELARQYLSLAEEKAK